MKCKIQRIRTFLEKKEKIKKKILLALLFQLVLSHCSPVHPVSESMSPINKGYRTKDRNLCVEYRIPLSLFLFPPLLSYIAARKHRHTERGSRITGRVGRSSRIYTPKTLVLFIYYGKKEVISGYPKRSSPGIQRGSIFCQLFMIGNLGRSTSGFFR